MTLTKDTGGVSAPPVLLPQSSDGGPVKVRLHVKISGTRNGEEWPDIGDEIELPEAEAIDLCVTGAAEPVPTDDKETADAKPPRKAA